MDNATTVQEVITEAVSMTTINDAIESIAEAINSVGVMDVIGFVVEIIGVIATVAAVIVALVANKKANDSIKISIKMQEQSKNVDLFEKRVELIEILKSDNKVSEVKLQLLFDKYIIKEYDKIKKCLNNISDIEHDIFVYQDVVKTSDGEGGYTSPLDEILDLEDKLERHNFPAEGVKEFEELCKKHEITYCEFDEPKVYNYKEMRDRLADANKELLHEKETLTIKMQKFVKDSISPIGD